MTTLSPEIANAKAIQQTLARFASSFDCEGTQAEKTIKLAFEAAAGLLKASIEKDAPPVLTLDEGLAFMNVLTAGMDRLLEYGEMAKIDVPFGR